MSFKFLAVLGLVFSMNLLAQPLEAQLARCLDEMDSVNESTLMCEQDVRAANFFCRPADRTRMLSFSPYDITIGVSELAENNPSLTAFIARRVGRPDAQIDLKKLRITIPNRDSLNCAQGLSSFMSQCEGSSVIASMELKASYRSSRGPGFYENSGGVQIRSINMTSSVDETGANLLFNTQIVMVSGNDEIQLNLPQRFQSDTDCRISR